MKVPFTMEQFMEVFANYNTSIWPFQVIIYLAALAAVFLVFKKTKYSDRLISAILGFLWIWMGAVYHLTFFSSINPAAKIFGTFFILQGFIFLFLGFRNKLFFSVSRKLPSYTGFFFILMGIIFYPVLSFYLGHIFPKTPSFGLPCPTTIFTFGLLLLSDKKFKPVIIIPFLWSLLGFSAAFSMGVREDVILAISGIITLLFYFPKK